MTNLNLPEISNSIPDYLFSNNLVTSGIVYVVEQPPANGCNHSRYQNWAIDKLPATASSVQIADRIGSYVSRCLTRSLLSVVQGVSTHVTKQSSLDDSDHPLGIIPSKLRPSLTPSATYHLCPFTKKAITSYQGKRLVVDDMCPIPWLFYPGEISLLISPFEGLQVVPDDPSALVYGWQYTFAVKGFEYVGPANPTDTDTSKAESWKLVGKSLISSVG